jgi:hypothetical protein
MVARSWAVGLTVAGLASLLLAGFPAARGAEQPATGVESTQSLEFFEQRIRPLLIKHCYECHSRESREVEGELLLDSRAGIRQGGVSGAAVVPGNTEGSLLLRAVSYQDENLQMPPAGRLADHEIADLTAWVKAGAADPREGEGNRPPVRRGYNFEEARRFWSFQPVTRPPVPGVGDKSWPKNDVDRFVLAKLEQHGMRPAEPASRRVWLRRATYDLIGLPPTPAEVQAFLSDESTHAAEAVLDRLLASPHYGERWGRHWLDVVRYADTSGCNADVPIPDAYRYRDYVIAAFNSDKPYDQFLREQLSGDLLPGSSESQRHEQIVATGYLAISRRYSSLNEEFYLTLEDTIDNFGKAFLGLSVGCARCHDHKFDPIPTADYYGLYGIFDSTRFAFPGTEIPRHSRDLVPLVPPDEYQRSLADYLAKMDELDSEIKRVYALKVSLDTGKERDAADKAWKDAVVRRDALIKAGPTYPRAFAVAEGVAHNARIHRKGDPQNLGEEVSRHMLQVLGGQRLPPDERGSGRLQLAAWVADRSNPLTARVMVNRIWQHHFGAGIVRTPNDFGTRGAAPTHPELLDYLAACLMDSGWSVKAMHKLIMLSAAYGMSSEERPSYLQADPNNERWWRFDRRRLDAEEIRDALLAVSGELDLSPGGPHPFPPEWEWRYTQHKPFISTYDSKRRSVYLVHQRIRKQPFFEVFDGADANTTTGQRPVSTTAIQALFLMNNPFAHEQAQRFAARVLSGASDDTARIRLAYEIALAREATPEEIFWGQEFLAQCKLRLPHSDDVSSIESSAWASYLRVLLSSNEFVFLD